MAKCRASRSPKDLEPGAYEVVLEPAAVAEIMYWLCFTAFGSKMYEDGSSFLAGRIGERVMGENVTIVDDALDPACPGLAFDFEGTPALSRRADRLRSGPGHRPQPAVGPVRAARRPRGTRCRPRWRPTASSF